MREIRLSGSEGGGAEFNRLSLPLSKALRAPICMTAYEAKRKRSAGRQD